MASQQETVTTRRVDTLDDATRTAFGDRPPPGAGAAIKTSRPEAIAAGLDNVTTRYLIRTARWPTKQPDQTGSFWRWHRRRP
jgi:hypothetical protein